MSICRLSISNFRNIQNLDWKLHSGLNVLEGENAQGKTNLLEALYYLANARSIRGVDDMALVRWGERTALLQGLVNHDGMEHRIQIKLSSENRELTLQGKPIRRMAQVHTVLRILAFTPDSTSLFRGSPTLRRRYFDHAIGLHQTGYREILNRYQKVLRQRNTALQAKSPASVLEPFNLQWAELALRLRTERKAYLDQLFPLWVQRLQQLFREPLVLSASWNDPVELTIDNLLQSLKATEALERRIQRTIVGPQRDDLELMLGGRPLKEIASQGQQRMVVISLKLAEADLFLKKFGKSLVFLLDDLGSELDMGHLQRLLEILSDIRAQTVLTTAHGEDFKPLGAQTQRVKNGQFVPV